MKNRLFIGISCIVLAVILSLGLVTTNVVLNTQKTTVYMTAEAIPEGTLLYNDNIKKVEVNKNDAASFGYITDETQIIGKYAAKDLVAGDIITTNKTSDVATAGSEMFLNIPEGMEASSFPVPEGAASLGGSVQEGDIIRIYADDGQGGTYVPDALNYVRVDMLSGEILDDNGNVTGYSTITILGYPEQIKVLKEINGGTQYSLISRGNDEEAQRLLAIQKSMLGINSSDDDSNSDNNTVSAGSGSLVG